MKIATLFLFLGISTAAVCAEPGARYAWHTVEKGETMYSISRLYGIKPADLAAYNDAVGTNMSIKVGQKLRVPANGEATADASASEAPKPAARTITSTESAVNGESASGSEIVHVVKKGETFYSVARLYNVDRNALQQWNELQDLNLKLGQKLVIHSSEHVAETLKPEPARPAAATVTMTASAGDDESARKTPYINIVPNVKEPKVSTNSGDVTASSMAVGLASTRSVKSWRTETASERMESNHAKATYDPASEYESVYYQSVYSGMPKRSDKGVAKLTQDNNQAYIAYYNNATVGTILRITNADNGRTTYAIVVGKVPEAENGAYMVKLSDRAARAISLKDYTSVELVCYSGN